MTTTLSSAIIQGAMGLAAGAIASFFFLSSCEEVGPRIDLTGTFAADTSYVTDAVENPQVKNVLLEEFTGVRCLNCPQGHALLDNLEEQYGSRLISVSAHSEFQAEPYPGDQDLRTPDAQALEDFLRPILAKPSGTIDRKKFPDDSLLLVFTSKWSSYVAQQMTFTTPVNIHIKPSYHPASRELVITVTLHYTAADTPASRLTVMLLEDGIVTAQLNGSVIDSHYVQRRVLRKILPSVSGMPLAVSRERGRVIVRSFTITLEQIWDAANLRLIAFVHRSQGIKEVLHAVQARVKP